MSDYLQHALQGFVIDEFSKGLFGVEGAGYAHMAGVRNGENGLQWAAGAWAFGQRDAGNFRDDMHYLRGATDTAWNYGGWSVPPYPSWGHGSRYGQQLAYDQGYADGRWDQAYADNYGSYFPRGGCGCDDPTGRYGYRLPFNPMPSNPWVMDGCW